MAYRAGPGPIRIALALITLAGILPAGAAQGDAAPEWVHGTGTWGSGEPEPANATWLILDQEPTAFHIVTQSGIQASCTNGNGTLTAPDGSGATGRCSGEPAGEQIHFLLETDPPPSPGENATLWSGTFTAAGPAPVTAPAPDESGSLLLLVLASATAASLGGATVLLLLFVRERRLTGHLARRLWERSRGKSASRRPESLEQENVRRILVRNKN